MPTGLGMPTVTVETGWSETYPYLRRDVDVWLSGGAGMITICLLINLNKRSGNRFAGILEVYRATAAGYAMTDRFVSLTTTVNLFTIYTYLCREVVADYSLIEGLVSQRQRGPGCHHHRSLGAVRQCPPCRQKPQ
jgi:hypothetical protein